MLYLQFIPVLLSVLLSSNYSLNISYEFLIFLPVLLFHLTSWKLQAEMNVCP
jgi:hypothetical protein